MAVIKYGSIVTSGRGSLGGSTLQPCHSGNILRNKPNPKKSCTQAQSVIRSYNKTMQAGWRALSDHDRQIWNDYAKIKPVFNRTGEKHPLSGHSLWLKYQFTYLNAGLEFLTNPYYYSADPVCPEFLPVYQAMPTKPSDALFVLYNTFVKNMVNSGVWSLFDYFYFLASHAEDSSLINWVNPGTYDITNILSTPFFVSEGYKRAVGNQYLNTNYNPASDGVNYTLNNASIGLYIRSNVAEARREMGSWDDVNWVTFMARWSTGEAYIRFNSIDQDSVSNKFDSRGFYIVNRTNSSSAQLFRNKVCIINKPHASSVIPDLNLFLLGVNHNGVLMGPSSKQISVAHAGAGMSQVNVDNYTDYLETLFDSIGAGVIP